MISDNSYLWAWKLERNSTLHITCTTWGYPGNVDLKLLYAIFRQADSMQSLTLTLTLAYNNLRSTFPVMPNFEGGGEMPFGMLSQLDPRNHVLAGVQITDEKRQF